MSESNPNIQNTLESTEAQPSTRKGKRRRRPWSRLLMFARRAHLYFGLFLLPWVFLYGITGAMFNHKGLFPEVDSRPIPISMVEGSPMSDFPTPHELASQVADAIDAATENVSVKVQEESGAKFTNDLMFEVQSDGRRHLLHINPHDASSYLVRFPEKNAKPEKLVDIKNVKLKDNPQNIAGRSAQHILDESGLSSQGKPRPHGWTKLNFLASVDGQPARVTYVLKDGHVDITKFDGSPGMSARGFFLKLHTSHGQTPSWTARMIWSLFVDTMAFAMVAWGVTGLLMWWQIKRVRLIGGVVMACSVLVAIVMYLAMQHYYATNML